MCEIVTNYCCWRIRGNKFGAFNRKGAVEAELGLFLLLRSAVVSAFSQ